MADADQISEGIGASAGPGSRRSRPAGLLGVGDVIRTAQGAPAEVVREPLTAHRGWSPFDEFELLVLVRVRKLASGSEPEDVLLSPNQPIELL